MKKFSFGLVLAMAVALMANESFARGGGGRGGFSGSGGRPGGNFGGGSGFSGGRSDFGGGNFGGSRPGGDVGGDRTGGELGNRAGDNRPDANRNLNQNNFNQNGNRNFSNNNFNRAPGELDNRGFRDQLNQFNAQRDVNRDVNRDIDRSNFDHGYHPDNKPFTPNWYVDHPGAWLYTHPNAGVWAAATWAAATSWLGWGAVPAESYSTAYYDDGSNDQSTAEQQTESAEDIAAAGADEPAADAQWLPLGTYALSTTPNADPTHMLQLFVSKDGILRGSYYDVTSDGTQTIKGSVDPATQRAAWSVGNGTVIFQTGLNELTQPTAPLTVKFENGKTNTWTLTRLNSSNTTASN